MTAYRIQDLRYNDDMTVTELRQKYPVFTYQSANWQVEGDRLQASFVFFAGENRFQHQVVVPLTRQISSDSQKKQSSKAVIDQSGERLIDQLVFSLGMVELLSYWKAFCSPIIEIQAGKLSDWQNHWWHTLLLNGMGEYFFVNQIDFTEEDFVKIVVTGQNDHNADIVSQPSDGSTPDHVDHTQPEAINSNPPSSFLIPIGGGKDSLVTLEILKQFHQQSATSPLSLLLINSTQAALDIADQANLPTITVSRQLDPHLLNLNHQGFLNGHIPFSASLAFISVLVAYLHSIDQVVLSNEASANEASLTYLNRPINHQYSKSFEFERKFREYVRDLSGLDKQVATFPDGTLKPPPLRGLRQVRCDSPYSSVQQDEVDTLPQYFSLLRPLNELQIGRLFAEICQSYFSIFLSCNRGSKTNTWCGDCPKCLFAYLMLAPWLDEPTMITIFGQNLLLNEKLLPTLHALIGFSDQKPLECVGLREESLVACYLLTKSYQESHNQLPTLLAWIQSNLEKQPDLPARSHQLLVTLNQDHFLPPSLADSLQVFFQGRI